MLFNSFEFAVFLTIVFILYWFVMNKNSMMQNLLLVIASFIFYALWDWRFLLLMVISKGVDFISTTQINKADKDKIKKRFLYLSIFVNISILCFFKYFNFFSDSFSNLFSHTGLSISSTSLNIIMPIGLSFYTMQALGYVIDVYWEKITPTYNIIEFFAFLSFFPLVLAGPIERAENLLPQLNKKRSFDYEKAADGLRQFLWGLFKKIVIADNCAIYANAIFNNFTDYSGSTLALGALFFTFQIYCDFSGYSDMAIGIAKLFNINLMQNFAFPYFSRNIGEFWRRWHISLSRWLFNYIFQPLQMSLRGYKLLGNFLALLITFLVSGMWHGSNWTFLVWGALNALYYLPLLIFHKKNNYSEIILKGSSSFKEIGFINIAITFSFTVFAWIFFRADSITHAIKYISKILSPSIFSIPKFGARTKALETIVLILLFITIEWFGKDQKYAIANLGNKWKKPFRYAVYYVIIFAIFWFGGKGQEFIYFQF